MENMHTDVRVLRAKGVTPSLRKVKKPRRQRQQERKILFYLLIDVSSALPS